MITTFLKYGRPLIWNANEEASLMDFFVGESLTNINYHAIISSVIRYET